MNVVVFVSFSEIVYRVFRTNFFQIRRVPISQQVASRLLVFSILQRKMTMQRIVPLQPSPLLRISHKTVSNPRFPALVQCLHTTTPRIANPLPITATGPPPAAPQPAASQYGEQVDRRRRQAELLKRGQDMRATHMKPGTAIKRRFWKDVSVQTDDGMTDLSVLNCTSIPGSYLQKANSWTCLIFGRKKLSSQSRHPRSSQSYNQRNSHHSPLKAVSCNSASSGVGPSCLRPAGYPFSSYTVDLAQCPSPRPRTRRWREPACRIFWVRNSL